MANKQDVPATEQAAAAAAPEAKTLSDAQIGKEVKPLSKIGFLAFFQRAWRAWLGVWYSFNDKHPTAAKLIGQFVIMFVFSNLVTIWQFLVMAVLPYAFVGLWDQAFVWPAVELPGVLDPAGNQLFYAIFNEPVQYNAAGEVIAGGLGNFVAFEIAVFTAQCINFPLQRNVTFRSNGNPVVQAIWYLIGWVLISIFVNAIWGIIQPFATSWGWNVTVPVAVQLLKTVITGGVSMVIFFFIFLIIFPDMNKVAKKARAKVEQLKASGASAFDILMAEYEANVKEEEALLANTRKDKFKLASQATSKSVAYTVMLDKIVLAENKRKHYEYMKDQFVAGMKASGADMNSEANKAGIAKLDAQIKEQIDLKAQLESNLDRYRANACKAIADKYDAYEKYENALAEVAAKRTERFEDLKKLYKGNRPLTEAEKAALAEYKAA